MPELDDWTVWIPTPLVLLIALIVTIVSGRPNGAASIVTDLIELLSRFAINNPELIFSPVSESTIIKSGDDM